MITLFAVCPSPTNISVTTTSVTVSGSAVIPNGLYVTSGGGYAEFPSVTGTACLTYTSSTPFTVNSFVLPYDAFEGSTTSLGLYDANGVPAGAVAGSLCTGTYCSSVLTGLDPHNFYVFFVANPAPFTPGYAGNPAIWPTSDLVDLDYGVPRGTFSITTGAATLMLLCIV